MVTRISFSRDAIVRNIAISDDRRSQRPALGKPVPPVLVQEDGKNKYWTFGLTVTGPSSVIYQRGIHPLAYIETDCAVIPTNATCDMPKRSSRSGITYLYIQLRWLQGNENKEWRYPLPPLTANRYEGGKWTSRCSYNIQVNGPSKLRYSLDKPLIGREYGVRLWMETLAEAVSKDGKWYEAVLSRKTFQP
jgi:hypothetical protein